MALHPRAGQPAMAEDLTNIAQLVSAYFVNEVDPRNPAQQVKFGTSGHRGCAFDSSFNEAHILAICQALVAYREEQGITGPLLLGRDTHALSEAAYMTALEVFIGNGIEVHIQIDDGYTPTPVISHAILRYNKGRSEDLCDGVVITPSHNPPSDGGFKYNPPHGGPADEEATGWIEAAANAFLQDALQGVRRMPLAQALKASTTHRYDYLNAYVNDLAAVIDLEAIRSSGLHLGVDPLGGAGVHYWGAIAQRYQLQLEIVN